MRRNYYLEIILFGLACFLMAILSIRYSFHDTFEYVTIAKSLAGYNNVGLFSTHSITYPAIMALFLKIWPSLTMLKLVNALFVFLIGLTLYHFYKSKSVSLIFIFSPLTWLVLIQISPILPASFFFLLSYIFLKEKISRFHLPLSGLFLGLSIAFYTPLIIVAFFMILAFFWNRKTSELLIYLLMISIGILPQLLTDLFFFSNPLYSFIRYFGTNVLILLGLNKNIDSFQLLTHKDFFLIFFAISPLLYKIYKVNFEDYKKELLFLIPVFLIFWIRGGLMKYFFIISPIFLIFLSTVFSKKEIKWHILLSIPFIVLLTFSNFTYNDDYLLEKDINSIVMDYDVEYIIVPGYEATKLASFIWEDSPEFVWYEDYQASLENKTILRGYNFELRPKNTKLNNILEFSASFKRTENITYNNYIVVSRIDINENFNKGKCYQILCVYEPK